MCNIPIYFCNIDIRHLQHASKIFETLEIDACDMQFQRNILRCLGEWILVDVWSSISAVVGCTRASSALNTANWVGGCEMCAGGLRSGYRKLHAGVLHPRPW